VNQNSSVHPVRRYRATGSKGPAEAAIAANISWLASRRSVVRLWRHSGLRQTGVRIGMRMLSSTRTVPPATTPAPNQSRRGASAASADTIMYAIPAPSSIPLRAIARQVTASAAVSGAVRHLIQPQPPGICLTST
jgi:hypothetical protein